MHRRLLPFLLALTLAGPARAAGLTLHPGRAQTNDLVLRGAFVGVPAGEARHLRHADLLAHPARTNLIEQPLPSFGRRPLTVLFLADLLKNVPLAPGADCVLARCKDRWESAYPLEVIQRWHPYLLLQLDGQPLEHFKAAANENLAPYFINVSTTRAPDFKPGLELGNLDPTQVVELVATNYAAYYAPWFSGAYAELTPAGETGRRIFLNQCAACHAGPGGACGGSLSTRPWEVVVVHATFNREYFRRYVRDPQAFIPTVAMPKHPHFTDEIFEQLIAFLSAKPKPPGRD